MAALVQHFDPDAIPEGQERRPGRAQLDRVAGPGVLCKEPNPLARVSGSKLRRLTSLPSIKILMGSRPPSGEMPIGTSSVTTATSDSKSMPQESAATQTGSVPPMKL